MTEAHHLPDQPNPALQPDAINGLAVTSLILGIVSLFFSWTIILAIVPIIGAVLGHLALTRMTGRNIAVAGLILNYIALLIPILEFIFVFVLRSPHFFLLHHPFLQQHLSR